MTVPGVGNEPKGHSLKGNHKLDPHNLQIGMMSTLYYTKKGGIYHKNQGFSENTLKQVGIWSRLDGLSRGHSNSHFLPAISHFSDWSRGAKLAQCTSQLLSRIGFVQGGRSAQFGVHWLNINLMRDNWVCAFFDGTPFVGSFKGKPKETPPFWRFLTKRDTQICAWSCIPCCQPPCPAQKHL